MNSYALIALTLSIIGTMGASADDVVVIVNPASAPMSREQVADVFLGRSNDRIPINQSAGCTIYLEFYKKAAGRNLEQVKEIWARILFTGRGLAPKQLPNSAAVVRAVAADPKAVGYVEKTAVDPTVKVALQLE